MFSIAKRFLYNKPRFVKSINIFPGRCFSILSDIPKNHDYFYRRIHLVNQAVEMLQKSNSSYTKAYKLLLKHQKNPPLTADEEKFLRDLKSVPLWMETNAAEYELKWVLEIDKQLQDIINNIKIDRQ